MHTLLLALVIIFGAFLRLYKLVHVPPHLNWDEVSHGYNAYSILTTGRDEWGRFLPAIFAAYGDYKLPVYIYTTATSLLLFGVNSLAVRIPSVLAGIGTVYATYLLSILVFSKIVKKGQAKWASLMAAGLVAVEPWSFFLGRPALEASLAQFLVILGSYFFLKGLEKHKYLLYSAIAFGVSVWTYNSARVFVPLMIFGLLLIFRQDFKDILTSSKVVVFKAALLLILFMAPMLYQFMGGVGSARYEKVAILDQGAINRIIEKRSTSQYPEFATKLIYNRFTYFSSGFTKNYLSHFSGNFLYIKGGDNYQFSLPGYGLLNPVGSIFMAIGLVKVFRMRNKWSSVLVLWFLLAPVASSLTRESPHVLRSITMLPIPMMFTSLGVVGFYEFIKKRYKDSYVYLTASLFGVLALVSGLYYVKYYREYFVTYPRNYSHSWQYGHYDLAVYLNEVYDDYDKIIITKKYGEPHEFLLFFGASLDAPWNWKPNSFRQDEKLIRFYQSEWFWVDAFDKFNFVNDWQVNEPGTDNFSFTLESGEVITCADEDKKCLLVTSPGNAPDGWILVNKIPFLDSSTAFEAYMINHGE